MWTEQEFRSRYREAVVAEGQSRDAAFLGIPERINGVLVRPFTLRHLTVLGLIGSPLVNLRDDLTNEELVQLLSRGIITPDHCAVFLWNVSIEFRPLLTWKDRRKHRQFIKHARKLDIGSTVKGILTYIKEAFADAPAGTAKKSVSYYSLSASVVDTLASEYGWSDDEILDKPLKRIWQYFRTIQQRGGSKAPMFNPSDKIKGDYLRALDAARKQ